MGLPRATVTMTTRDAQSDLQQPSTAQRRAPGLQQGGHSARPREGIATSCRHDAPRLITIRWLAARS